MAIAPERVAELIRALAEARHYLGVVLDEVESHDSPLAQLYTLRLNKDVERLEEVFSSVHSLAGSLTDLRDS